jgi:uncharacterized lipoprotein (TIGR02269 family)
MASSGGMTTKGKKWGLWAMALSMAACAALGPEVREQERERPGLMEAWVAANEGAGEACEEEDSCVTLVCGEEACGVYRCEDVEPEPALLALRGGVVAAPGSSPRRNWGRPQGLPGDGAPVFIIPWNVHNRRPQLPSEIARLQILDPIKHHIFSQQPKLARWFKRKGINIHSHTMVLERAVHNRIHRGPEGGPWNAEWRQFMTSNPEATQAQIWEQAVKMIFRFELTGPIVPYHWRVRPQPPPSDAR